MQTLDAPEIRRMERLGAPRAEQEPRCPVCGAACEWIYLYRGYDPAGCEECLKRADAWQWQRRETCGENR